MTEKYRPEVDSECHDLPWRPWPAVCSSAPATVPEGAPDAANRLASFMVDSMVGYHSIHRSGNRARSIARSKSIERVAILLDLGQIFRQLRSQILHDSRRRAVQKLFVCELALDVNNELLQLVVLFVQPLPQRPRVHFRKLKR